MFSFRRFVVCLTGLCLVSGSGCGVDDYERKMLEAQARIKRFEEESALLGPALSIPRPRDKDGSQRPIADLFLRPPIGIRTSAVSESEPRANLLFTYPSRKADTGPVVALELAVGEQEDFDKAVIRCFLPKPPASRERTVHHPLRQSAETFQTTEDDDQQYFYSINIAKPAKQKIAIVYKVAKEQRDAAARAIQMSLESFAVNQEATRQRELAKKGPQLEVPGHQQQ
jgi:hypothetical protein